MEAYFNELTVGLFFGNKEAKDAFSLLGRCLGKLSELGISNVRMTNEVMGKAISVKKYRTKTGNYCKH